MSLRGWAWMIPFALLAGCGNEPIGFVGTLSGPAAELGLAGRDGCQLHVELHGGTLLACDDHGSAEGGRACLRELAAKGVRVVVGPMVSAAALGMPALADSLGLLIVSPTVSAQALGGRVDRFVRLMPDNSRQSRILAEHVLDASPRRVHVIHEIRNGAYARRVADDFAKRVESVPRWTVARDSFESGVGLDFARIIARIPDSSPVLLVGSSMDHAVFQKDRARAGKRFECLGSQWGMGEELLRIAGVEAEGSVFCGMMPEYEVSTPEYASFARSYRSRFGRTPTFGAAFAYEAMAFSRDVARRGGDPFDALAKAIAHGGHGALGWDLDLDSAGDSRRLPVLFVVSNGTFKQLR